MGNIFVASFVVSFAVYMLKALKEMKEAGRSKEQVGARFEEKGRAQRSEWDSRW